MNTKPALLPDIITVDTNHQLYMQTQPIATQSQNDSEAVAKIQAGQTDSFIPLYDAYVDKIYRFLFYRINHKETAEDLTSQTFLKAYDNIHSFQSDKGTFQAWLYRIAYNLLIDHYRKYKPSYDISFAEQIASTDRTEKLVEDYFNQQQVQDLLQQLPEATQELIILRIWEDLPYAEIAKILNKTENSLKMQFSRAMSALRQLDSKS